MAIGARCMIFGMETDTYGVSNITSKSTFVSMTMQKFEVVDDGFNVDRICSSVICSSQRLTSSSSSNKSKNNNNDDDDDDSVN